MRLSKIKDVIVRQFRLIGGLACAVFAGSCAGQTSQSESERTELPSRKIPQAIIDKVSENYQFFPAARRVTLKMSDPQWSGFQVFTFVDTGSGNWPCQCMLRKALDVDFSSESI